MNYTKNTYRFNFLNERASMIFAIIQLFSLLCCEEVSAQSSSIKYDFHAVTNKIQGWVDSGYYNGASVIIVKDNKVVLEKYFGNYKLETVAFVASAGKWLAAATIAALVDDGRLSWNDKVKKWLPEFSDQKGEATLAQLLSHTAGYPDYQPKDKPIDIYQSLKESVAHILPLPADTLAGSIFKYGGLEYAGGRSYGGTGNGQRLGNTVPGKDCYSSWHERYSFYTG